MSSANQLYKASGSNLPFKEWLKREQLKGSLKVKEKEFVNATGSTRSDIEEEQAELILQDVISDKEAKAKFRNGLLLGVVLGVVGKILFDKFYTRK